MHTAASSWLVSPVGSTGPVARALFSGIVVALLTGCTTVQSAQHAHAERQVFITPSDQVLVLPLRDGSCLPVYGNHVMCHLTGEHLEAGDVPKGSGTEFAALLFAQLQALGVSLVGFDRSRELLAGADPSAVDRYEPPLAADLGTQAGATKVLMGVVSRYEERSGTRLGNGQPAAVAFSLALVDVGSGTVTHNVRFIRGQFPVTTNLFALPTWWTHGIQWQTRKEVANEAVAEAARGLIGISDSPGWTAHAAHPVTPEPEQPRRPAFMSEW